MRYLALRKIYLLIFIIVSGSSNAQSKIPYSSLQEALLSGAKLSGISGPSSVNWTKNGEKYAFKAAKNVIKLYDPATDREETIFDPSNVKFPGSDKAFTYQSFEWSKDDKYLVFRTNIRPVWRNSGYADYYMYSLDQKQLKLIAEKAYTAEISPDGKKVGFERDGNLFVTDLSTGQQQQLTSDAKDFFYNGRFGWAYEEEFMLVKGWEWSPDGASIAFWQSDERHVPLYRYTDYSGFKEHSTAIPYPRVGDENPTVRIGVIHLSSKKKVWMKIDAEKGYLPRIYWTAAKDTLAIVRLNRKQNHMELFFVNTISGNGKKVFEEKSDTWIEVASFGGGLLHMLTFPNHLKEFYWISERDGWSHLYRYDYDGKLIQQVTKGNWDLITVFHIDHKKQKIYFSSTEKSPLEKHLYVMNINGTEKKILTTTSGKHNINFGGQYFIDTWSNTTTPKQVDLCDNNGRLIKKIQDNNAVQAFIKDHQYAPQSLENFVTTDGQKIDISIIKPFDFDSTKKYPLYLEVYGGPGHQDVYNEFETNTQHQYLAQLGYVVLKVNNRGSAGYGKKFKHIVYGKLGHYECLDFAEAVKYMTSRYSWVDKNRVGIKGHSYGGFTSAYSVLQYPDIYKTAIIAAPVSDWRNYDAIYTEKFMGVLPENVENYDRSAVLNKMGTLKRKVLLTHSTSDDNVHVKNTMQLISALIDAGKDAELRIYQKGGHSIIHDLNSYILLTQQYVDFLEKNLK